MKREEKKSSKGQPHVKSNCLSAAGVARPWETIYAHILVTVLLRIGREGGRGKLGIVEKSKSHAKRNSAFMRYTAGMPRVPFWCPV